MSPDFLPEERDWQSHVSLLTGDIDRNDINSGGIALDPGHISGANSFHVVTSGGTGSEAVLDGFVITAGQANNHFREFRPGWRRSGEPQRQQSIPGIYSVPE